MPGKLEPIKKEQIYSELNKLKQKGITFTNEAENVIAKYVAVIGYRYQQEQHNKLLPAIYNKIFGSRIVARRIVPICMKRLGDYIIGTNISKKINITSISNIIVKLSVSEFYRPSLFSLDVNRICDDIKKESNIIVTGKARDLISDTLDALLFEISTSNYEPEQRYRFARKKLDQIRPHLIELKDSKKGTENSNIITYFDVQFWLAHNLKNECPIFICPVRFPSEIE